MVIISLLFCKKTLVLLQPWHPLNYCCTKKRASCLLLRKANLSIKECLIQLCTLLTFHCSLSYCDHSPSVVSVQRPSVHNFLVNTLASTNINQSAPNLVKVYMTIRSQMSLIMELIGPELSKLSAVELENLPYLTLFTL